MLDVKNSYKWQQNIDYLINAVENETGTKKSTALQSILNILRDKYFGKELPEEYVEKIFLAMEDDVSNSTSLDEMRKACFIICILALNNGQDFQKLANAYIVNIKSNFSAALPTFGSKFLTYGLLMSLCANADTFENGFRPILNICRNHHGISDSYETATLTSAVRSFALIFALVDMKMLSLKNMETLSDVFEYLFSSDDTDVLESGLELLAVVYSRIKYLETYEYYDDYSSNEIKENYMSLAKGCINNISKASERKLFDSTLSKFIDILEDNDFEQDFNLNDSSITITDYFRVFSALVFAKIFDSNYGIHFKSNPIIRSIIASDV